MLCSVLHKFQVLFSVYCTLLCDTHNVCCHVWYIYIYIYIVRTFPVHQFDILSYFHILDGFNGLLVCIVLLCKQTENLVFASPCIIILSTELKNKMQQIPKFSFKYSSTCFGCHAPIIRSIKNCICDHWYTLLCWCRYLLTPWPDPDDGCMTPETCRVV